MTSVWCLKRFNSESKQTEETHGYINGVAKSLKECSEDSKLIKCYKNLQCKCTNKLLKNRVTCS